MGGWNWGGRRVIGQGDGVGMSTEQREGKRDWVGEEKKEGDEVQMMGGVGNGVGDE